MLAHYGSFEVARGEWSIMVFVSIVRQLARLVCGFQLATYNARLKKRRTYHIVSFDFKVYVE